MTADRYRDHRGCCGASRRRFLADSGLGFTGLVLGAMLHRDGIARAPPWRRGPHRMGCLTSRPKAKSVIWLFMVGGVSHMESFDPKPALDRYAGKTIAETPFKAVLDSPFLKKNVRESCRTAQGPAQDLSRCRSASESAARAASRSATGGRTWATVPTTWPSSARCGRPTTTTAPSFSFTPAGTCSREHFPTIGSWVHYGLGSLNDNLPQFVVLGDPAGRLLRRRRGNGANYLGPSTAACSCTSTRRIRCPSPCRGRKSIGEEQAEEFELLGRAEPAIGASSIRTTRRCGPGSSRTNWRSECRRPCRR